jgi:hypothetical protein
MRLGCGIYRGETRGVGADVRPQRTVFGFQMVSRALQLPSHCPYSPVKFGLRHLKNIDGDKAQFRFALGAIPEVLNDLGFAWRPR